MKQERISYVMLFCALILVKNGKASLEEAMRILPPLPGRGKQLVAQLALAA